MPTPGIARRWPGYPAIFMLSPTTPPLPHGGAGSVSLSFADGPSDGPESHPSTLLAERLMRRLLGTRHGARLLDVGCGDGSLARAARDAGAGSIVALDISASEARRARSRSEGERLTGVIQADAHALPFAPGRFDLVVANLFGEIHASCAAALAELLAPGGALVVAGTLLCDVARVSRAYRLAGLEALDSPITAAGWAAVAHRRARA